MAKPILYGPTYSTYARTARIVLAEKGVDYDLRDVDLLKGETQNPDYLAIQPFGKVPALKHGDFTLYETLAIATYVDAAFDGPALFPGDAQNRARAVQIAGIIDSYAYGAIIGGVFWERAIKPMLEQQPDENAVQQALPKAQKALRAIEQIAGADGWLAGASFGVADAFLAPIVTYAGMTPEKDAMLGDCPRLLRWWTRASEHPSVKTTVPQLG